MLHTGLVSVTFRKLSPSEIVALVAQAGLEGIEWGGDIHVAHGDLPRAREVRRITEDAGLKVAAYGSYYRVGDAEPVPFERVLESAIELGAPTIRVWAGKIGSEAADAAYRERVIDDSRRIGDLAARHGIAIAYEYHRNTLTDTPASAEKLLAEVAHANVGTYWQPPVEMPVEESVQALRGVLPRLINLHAFWWVSRERRPLAEGATTWKRYMEVARGSGRSHSVLLEFVADDSPEAFLRDATTLKELTTTV